MGKDDQASSFKWFSNKGFISFCHSKQIENIKLSVIWGFFLKNKCKNTII